MYYDTIIECGQRQRVKFKKLSIALINKINVLVFGYLLSAGASSLTFFKNANYK